MGADPLTLLVGTPLGAGCAGVACVLQLAGVCWTERLSRVDLP
jgi:tight adherence protein B